MRIGELAARTGVSRRSLRYYEEQGLLVSSRSPSGQRYYDVDHVQLVLLIKEFLAAGMSSRTIAAMVPCMANPSTPKARQALVLMKRERLRLSSDIEALTAARGALDNLISTNEKYLVAAEPVEVSAGQSR